MVIFEGPKHLVDKATEMMERKGRDKEMREDIKGRMEALLHVYGTWSVNIDTVRKEIRDIHNTYLERVQSGRSYDEDYLAEVQSNHDLLLELQREREEFDPEQDVLST